MKSVTLPELPKDISPEIKEQKYVKYEIEKPELHPVEKVGDRLMKYQKCSENGFEKYYEIESKNESEECEDDSDYEEESPELLKLNPYNWKSQDHYAVLGLSKLRINATDEDIKNAYRKKVLRHHPDKKASDGNSNNDSFFKCIQKAYEIITDPVKRRQFDSVDPEFDESIPTKCSKEDFFEVLTPVFERNARFSNIQPVPSLGDMDSTREEVEEFYRFWANFDSWRSFEYLDEEDADSYENREDRRYFERKNKNARAKHKKEDNQRIINLIDLAVRTDPRLALFKKADREAKEAKRLEKKAAQIAAAEEEKKRKEEEEKAKERALKEEQEKVAREKKEKEMKKRVIRKEKKTLKKFLQENNYLIDPASPASPEQIESQLKKLDGYTAQMDADNLTAYRVYLLRAFENGWESASKYFDEDHLNEGEKYSAELAAMAPVEEVKEEVEEVKKESVVEPVVEEKKEEVEKVEVVEEKKEPEVKPAVARMLKKLPSISRIGGMRRTKKKVIRKEYDSSSEDERELEKEKEKEKEEAAPETASKKKNKKKKKSKKKNSSEELKVNVEEETATKEIKEATPVEGPATEEVKEEVVAPAEEQVTEEVKEAAPVEEPVVEEVKEEIVIPAKEPVVDEIKEAAPIEEPTTEEVKEEVVTPVAEKSVEPVEEVKEVDTPVEVKEVVVEEVKGEGPTETKPEIKSSKKIKKKKSRAKIDAKPKEEKKEEKKEVKKEPKKPEVPVKSKEDILKEVKKQEEENAKRIKDILKKKVSMGKLRTKKSSRKLREEKKEKEEEEKKEELTITIKDDNKKKTKAERKAEKAAKKAAKKAEAEAEAKATTETEATKEAPVEEPVVVEEAKEEVTAPADEEPVVVEEVKEEVKEEVAAPAAEEIHEVRGMYEVKPVYGDVPEIDTKTKMYTVKSIYGDNVIVDLPLTASQRLNGVKENAEPTVVEEVKEEVAAPAAEEPVVVEVKEENVVPATEESVAVEEVKEEIIAPVAEEIHEVRGMYTVKPVYGDVPEIDTKTKMYTVKSIYGDNVIVDLPLTASQRLNGNEENVEPATEETSEIEEVEEKIEVINEVNEDKTEVEEKTEITEENTEIEEKTEVVEETATEVEEKIEVETITINEPAKKEDNTEKPVQAKTLKHCPSGISLKPWTSEQQTKLEEALQKFPSTQFKENPMDRWIEISNYVGRSRTDIKFRIKDLAETIRRKRSIQSLKGEN